MFVGSGTDDESVCFSQSLDLLSHREDFDLLELSFFRLLRHAANRSRCYRGYLLNMAVQPATAREIGLILNKDTRQAQTILKVLAGAKLIEQVDCPAFDPSKNDLAPADGTPPETPPPDDTPQGKSKKKRSRNDSFPENPRNFGKPFKKTANGKPSAGNLKAAAPQAQSASDCGKVKKKKSGCAARREKGGADRPLRSRNKGPLGQRGIARPGRKARKPRGSASPRGRQSTSPSRNECRNAGRPRGRG